MITTAEVWVKMMLSTGSIVSIVADLTPDIATYLLEQNTQNRKIRQSVVDAYARDMASGNWEMNGEPIIVAEGPALNDGQHRCWAVVQAGRSIRTVFTFGVRRETMKSVDQGIARRLSDHLELDGMPTGKSTRLATLSGMIYRYKVAGTLQRASSHGGSRTNSRATHHELREMVERDPSILRAVSEFTESSINMRSVAAISHFQFLYWLLTLTNPVEEVVAFIERIANGTDLTKGSPELYVRNRLINERGRLHPNETMELLIRAWNSHVRGETVHAYHIAGGKLPDVRRLK